MRRMGLILRAAPAFAWFACIAITSSPREARAADRDRGARWYVDVSGASCSRERATFEREVALACAAVETCHVVGDVREAELRATLRCGADEEPWTLELRTVEGALVSSTELAGAAGDRLREAAVEIARDQAPERMLAAASLRDTLSDGDQGARKPWKMPTMSLAFGGAGAVGGVEGYSGGARGLLGLAIARSTHLTLGVTALAGGSGASAARHLRSGLGLAFGAPFDGFFGMALEGGVDVGQSYETTYGYRTSEALTRAGAYGQGSVVLAVPVHGVRPYVSFNGGAYSQPKTTIYASADLGVALELF